jgi:3-hydroxyisobutyrate dehydrogenase-like beta-hydroxyacid dehydrogenase
VNTPANVSNVFPVACSLAGRRIGFLGAGQIGTSMVRRLMGAGAELRVHTRRPEAHADLRAAGARLLTDLRALGAGNEIVISCLFSDAQLQAVTPDLSAGLQPGSVLISHTTGSPTTTRALAAALSRRDVGVVEAPFSGAQAAVQAGRLTVMLAGAPEHLDRAEPVLRAYANSITRVGPIGTALVIKLLNNLMFTANVQLALDLARIAEQLDFPLSDVIAVLGESSGATRALAYLGEFGTPAALRAEVQPFLRKDMAVCATVADALGVDLGLLGEVVQRGPLDL